jgi:hypothetical protein
MEETMRHVMEAASSINAKLVVLNERAGNINQVREASDSNHATRELLVERQS